MSALIAFVLLVQEYTRPSWPDQDRDGLNTRHEILLERCLVYEQDERARPVVVRCFDEYTGEIYHGDASALDVDHAIAWANLFHGIPERYLGRLREIYADPDNLVLTSRSINRSKGAKTLSEFCPEFRATLRARAWRLHLFVARWSIDLSDGDRAGLRAWAQGQCVD